MEFKTTAVALFVFLAVLAYEGAGVPVQDDSFYPRGPTTTTEGPGPKLCSRVTPCRWGVYDKDTKRINLNIENPTCICGPDRRCAINEDNLSKGAFIFRCISNVTTTTPTYYGSSK